MSTVVTLGAKVRIGLAIEGMARRLASLALRLTHDYYDNRARRALEDPQRWG